MTAPQDSAASAASRTRTLDYIPELDGLRTIAVMAVLAFHFSIPGFSGGYLGVDVFFVLSGFLISKILIGQRQSGTFSYASFYLNRFWRLFPALLTTVLLTLAAGAVLFSPYFFEPLSASALSATFSFSNIYFWLISGYFDQDAITKPLLHTWSLSVEEQFYLIWPVLIGLILRITTVRNRFILILAIAGISLGAAELTIQRYPSAAFYLMPFRIFEFAAGALVSLLPSRRIISRLWANNLLFVGALLALLSSITLFDETTPIPGRMALIPCVASALIFLTAEQSSYRRLLANRPMIYFGQISYSLYLVHWPLVVFFQFVFLDIHQPWVFTALLLSTWLLADGLHRFVESPFRNRSRQSGTSWANLHRGPIILAIALCALIPAAWVTTKGDLPGRYPTLLTTEEIATGKGRRFVDLKKHCRIDQLEARSCFDDEDNVILVIGNSHEPDALNAMAVIAESQPDLKLVYFGTTNKCQLTIDDSGVTAGSDAKNCQERAAVLNDSEFIARLDHIVYSARYTFSANKQVFLDLFERFRQQNDSLKFTIFGDYIITKIDCSELINRFGSSDACRRAEHVANPESIAETSGPLRDQFLSLNPRYISKWSFLCETTDLSSCSTTDPGGVPMFYDQHHLSYEFARYLGTRMNAEGLVRYYVDDPRDI